MSKIAKCICGKDPIVNTTTSYSGGGRYRGKTRCDAVEIRCETDDCPIYRVVEYDTLEPSEELIDSWHKYVDEQQEEQEANDIDKLIYNLEHYPNHLDSDISKALALILKKLYE